MAHVCALPAKALGMALLFSALSGEPAAAERESAGEKPQLGVRIEQAWVEAAGIRAIRREGLRIFSTPFNRLDGLGDGPIDPLEDRTQKGNRPTLQNPDTPFLRSNGLDSQTCLECHGVSSTTSIPATSAVGGTAGFAASPFPDLTQLDGADLDANGVAEIDGRVINPPINFGSGGLTQLGKEMTVELQALKALALASPGAEIPLVAKGVHFGSLVCFADSSCDANDVEGVDEDLVVKPFGRKGEFATTRSFDVSAFQFHHGMQPIEVVGEGVDADGDGVIDEITVGELSAVSIFLEGLEPPAMRPRRLRGAAKLGFDVFEEIGCADCHIPSLVTDTPLASFSFPQIDTDPFANVYRTLDLSEHGFEKDRDGPGVVVPLFGDLKRHDMGDRLEESTGSPFSRYFTTARLWSVADTAPYLHDGRATTLSEAILFHDGEGAAASASFEALRDSERNALLAFLRTLRSPEHPNRELLRVGRKREPTHRGSTR